MKKNYHHCYRINIMHKVLGFSKYFLLLCIIIISIMLSTKEVIKILKKFKVDSASKYGITSLGLFGSFARNQQNETSDVDVFVTLKESDFFVLERIREELENLVHKKIDIVNYRESLQNSFKQNILNDAIYIS